MTASELIALLSSSASIAPILSKFFLPPEALNPEINMEYFAEQTYLQYIAKFQVPRQRFSFINKRIPRIQLDCGEGFLSINARLETEADSRELLIPTIHCSVPPLAGKEEMRLLAGKWVFIKIQVSIDLNHRIGCTWLPMEEDSNHLKASVTNTMDIQVKDFKARTKLPSGRKLKKVNLIINGTPRYAPVIVQHKIELYSHDGNLEIDLPTVDTSDRSWINAIDAERRSEIIVPIDLLKGRQELIIDLLFGPGRNDLESLRAGESTPREPSLIVKVFNLVERNLRKMVRSKPDNEDDVQDIFENLLMGAEVPYSRETERIEYSSKTYTPDFTIHEMDIAIEIKLCNRDNREKEIIAEINDDILAYQTKYRNLMFVIYDLGFIRDVDRFASTFEKNQNVIIKIIKH